MSDSETQSLRFDPLRVDEEDLTVEILGAKIKREILNIIKSYNGWYDPFSEIIQNALDSVDERVKNSGESSQYVPTLWIEINLKNNSLSVTDNGIGFNEKKFKNFLKPSLSWKGTQTRGSKGVGATYVAYGFNFLNMGTKSDGFSYSANLKRGREWVEDERNIIPRPETEPAKPFHEVFNTIDTGSTFTLKFDGPHTYPSTLKWPMATTAKQWEYLLRINTPLGGIYLDRDPTKTVCHLSVINESGEEDNLVITNCKYVFPHEVIPSCIDLKEVLEAQDKMSEKGKDAARLPSMFSNLNGIYAHWNYEDILQKRGTLRPNLTDEQKQLLSKHKVHVYGFFCYSTGLWDEFNDRSLALRKGGRVLRGGLQMASNGMPQGKLVVIPLLHQ